jgi:hypothetical protein
MSIGHTAKRFRAPNVCVYPENAPSEKCFELVCTIFGSEQLDKISVIAHLSGLKFFSKLTIYTRVYYAGLHIVDIKWCVL